MLNIPSKSLLVGMARLRIYSPDIGVLPGMALDMPVELWLGPVDLAAGLAGVLGAQVDLVVDGHVPHLAVQAHDGAAQVAHEPLVLPHLGGHLGDLHVRLALRNELYIHLLSWWNLITDLSPKIINYSMKTLLYFLNQIASLSLSLSKEADQTLIGRQSAVWLKCVWVGPMGVQSVPLVESRGNW